MAMRTLGLLALGQNFLPGIQGQVNRASKMLSTLSLKAGSGQNVAWVAKGDGAQARNHEEGEDAADLTHDGQFPAVLHWGEYDSPFGISDLAVAAAGSSTSPTENIALWGQELLSHIEILTSTENKHLFYGTGPKRIVSFDEAIGKDDNVYAGIDRGDPANAFWRPNVFDAGVPTAMTRALVRSDLARIAKRGGGRPDIAVCSVEAFQSLATSMFDDKLQFVVTSTNTLNTSRGQITLQGQVDTIQFGSTTFVEDKDATATEGETSGQIFYINTALCALRYLPILDAQTRNRVAQEMGSDGYRELPLGIAMKKLPDTGHAEKAMVYNKLQLQVLRPNAMGVRRNVSIA